MVFIASLSAFLSSGLARESFIEVIELSNSPKFLLVLVKFSNLLLVSLLLILI